MMIELKKMLEFKQEQQEEQQTIFLLGMILWELDKHEQAFAEFKKINNSKVFNPLLPSAFSDEMSQFIVQYLTIESKDYFEKNQYFDFGGA